MTDAKRWARQDDRSDKNAENNRCEEEKVTLHLDELKQRDSTIVG